MIVFYKDHIKSLREKELNRQAQAIWEMLSVDEGEKNGFLERVNKSCS